MQQINSMVENQRAFYMSGATRDIQYRKNQLRKLKLVLQEHEEEILSALKEDLNKSTFEAYITELGMVYKEISFMLKNVERFSKPKNVRGSITNFPSKSTVYKEPYGVVLIISPWNYPFQLAMNPLVAAIATGNCAVVKPSNYSRNTSKIIAKIIAKTFNENYISVVLGDRNVNQTLLDIRFDYIFFTGGISVGKLVMEKAAKHLTPVTLELGGKSPCIVDKTANIALSAKRIVWGKLLNAGQTCVAPDYILVDNSVKSELVKYLKKYIFEFYGEVPQNNENYPKIINQKHFERLSDLIARAENVWGGKSNLKTGQISPAIMENINWNSEIMEEEIFGPIFPIIGFDDLRNIVSMINARPKPLALYLFTRSSKSEEFITKNISYGGGCINDTIAHLISPNLPFGGVGESGMGSYHGKLSFDTFSHSKGVMKKSNFLDLPLRYIPSAGNLKIIKMIFK